MKTVRDIAAMRAAVRDWREVGERVALVPTMGNLHRGHLSLVELARARADRVVVSIYVNPTQFGPSEDYADYPRTLDADRRRLRRAGADVVFVPGDEEMYPFGLQAMTRVSVPLLTEKFCGASRPGHFDGVTSVVARLFGIVQPDLAVFGQKDYQQWLVIRRMTADLHMPVEILSGPTQRERDGLALSSRNQYLDPDERRRAPALYRSLQRCAQAIEAGRRDYAALEADGRQALEAAGFQVDYFAVCRADDLAPPAAGDRQLVILAAGRLGRARLIDNVLVSSA